MPNLHNPPAIDEIEVSLFGPGFGEAVAVHLGFGRWLLVDSCYRTHSTEPVSLSYLNELNVDVRNAVVLIIVTHWHSDHIAGISKIVDACESAKVAIPDALQCNEFFKLVELYRRRQMLQSTGIHEFETLFSKLKERMKGPLRATRDKLLFAHSMGEQDPHKRIEVFSLSPSDEDSLLAQLALSNVMPKGNDRPRRIPVPERNDASIALWIKSGQQRILLGADVESGARATTGWNAILADAQCLAGQQASVFKVSHHGARSGHHPDIWTRLLLNHAIALVTPYNRGRVPLPTRIDMERLTSHTSNAFVTSRLSRKSYKPSSRVVADQLRLFARKAEAIIKTDGHIRLRRAITETQQEWRVELFGSACKVTDLLN